MSREVAETNLRQDIEYVWEPWLDRDSVSQSSFSRAIRNALASLLLQLSIKTLWQPFLLPSAR